jgi:hypothetical protein
MIRDPIKGVGRKPGRELECERDVEYDQVQEIPQIDMRLCPPPAVSHRKGASFRF